MVRAGVYWRNTDGIYVCAFAEKNEIVLNFVFSVCSDQQRNKEGTRTKIGNF